MIKNTIAGISILLALWACVHLYSLDKKVNKLQNIATLIKKSEIKVHRVNTTQIKKELAAEQKEAKEESSNKAKDKAIAEKIAAIKAKAGNIAAFDVSPLYKKNCSSCHGNIGEGIIGPKLMGRSKDYILTNLKAFKSGQRKNYIMYGLLQSLSDEQLTAIATEISTFQAKLDAANK